MGPLQTESVRRSGISSSSSSDDDMGEANFFFLLHAFGLFAPWTAVASISLFFSGVVVKIADATFRLFVVFWRGAASGRGSICSGFV